MKKKFSVTIIIYIYAKSYKLNTFGMRAGVSATVGNTECPDSGIGEAVRKEHASDRRCTWGDIGALLPN